MPFKKLSRRTFLTASSALAFLHTPFARALPARQIVNINDYNPHDWIASFKLKWFTEFGHLNRGDMLTSEQHRCHNEKKKFQRRV